MEDLGQTQSTKQGPDHNNNERGGGGIGEKENYSLRRRGPINMGWEKWWGVQLKRNSELHHGPRPRKSSATVGKDLGQLPVAKNQNFQMASTSQPNFNLENLRTRGFIGPARCHLCQAKEETTNHLLDECNYTTEIWDWAAGIFRQSNRTRGNINATINNWNECYSENEMVNLCWNLMAGMIIWAIWKERNRRIFKNESLTKGKLKEAIISQIQEVV
jgi:hypothetical protein